MDSKKAPCPGEGELADYVGCALAGEARQRIEVHLVSCSACLATVAEAAKLLADDDSAHPDWSDDAGTSAGGGAGEPAPEAPPLALRPGLRLGRYVLGELLGSGAMGVVYAAHDPDLGRRVAIKLVRPAAGTSNDARAAAATFREAQAMAKLSHPNVVAVYDVGTYEGRIFLAMELVDGRTLGEWLGDGKERRWREVLEVLVAAGRGLAAAHAVGIVHRDFKPANVLVGQGGRVCVSDFGLARAAVDEKLEGAEAGRLPDDAAPAASTEAGRFAGTPRYMAPERFAGAPASAASDVYGFCVAAYEALYGAPPFPGDTLPELVAAMRRDVLRSPPAGKRPSLPPSWVRAALRDGLRADPALRTPTMPALLARLTRDPRARLLRLTALGGVVAAASVLTAVAAQPEAPGACGDARAQLLGVWDAPRKAEVRRAFAKSGKPYATEVAQLVEATLDRYADALVAEHTSACEATRVRGVQSETALGRRMGCLARRRHALTLLTSRFVEGGGGEPVLATTLENAAQAARALPSVARCAEAGLATRPAPESPGAREHATALASHVSALRAHYHLGQYRAALPLGEGAVRAARALGEPAKLAGALWWLGASEAKAGRSQAAEETLADAVKTALACGADDVAARAAILLASLTLERAPKGEASLGWIGLAEALLRKGADAALEPSLLLVRGKLLANGSRYDDARAAFEAALRRYEETVGAEHPDTAKAMGELSSVLRQQGKYAEALAIDTRAVATLERALGREHPRLVPLLGVLARDEALLGRVARATPHLTRALAIAESALGEQHPQVARTLRRICINERRAGRYQQALASCKRSLALVKRARGTRQADLAMTHTAMGQVLFELGRPEALDHLRRDLEITEVHFGARHPDLPAVLSNLAHVLSMEGRPDAAYGYLRRAARLLERNGAGESLAMADVAANLGEAKRLQGKSAAAAADYERALHIMEKALGPKDPQLAAPLTGLGMARLARGDPTGAAEALERALALQSSADAESADRGETEFALARALWNEERTRARALSLAASARAHYRRAAPRYRRKELPEVDRWLKAHAPRR